LLVLRHNISHFSLYYCGVILQTCFLVIVIQLLFSSNAEGILSAFWRLMVKWDSQTITVKQLIRCETKSEMGDRSPKTLFHGDSLTTLRSSIFVL